jgi:ABC-type spermidine/putrescine transport system permease subunit II
MVNGKLAFGPCASLLFCLAFVIIMIALYVKKYRLDKEEAAEDDM